jgi:PAS domain S-box-containing protein
MSEFSSFDNHFFDENSHLLSIMDNSGQFLSVSDAWVKLLGVSKERMLNSKCTSFMHPDDHTKAKKHLENMTSNTTTQHFFCTNRYLTVDGEVKYLKWYSRYDRDKKTIFNFTVDSTEEFQKIELIDQLQTSAQIGHYRCDIVGDSFNLYWSQQTYIIHELEPDAPLNIDMAINFYHPDYIPLIREAVKNVLDHGLKFEQDFQIITAKGNTRWVRSIGNPQISGGKIVGFWGTFQDIHEQKIKAQRLELFKKAIDSTSDGVILTAAQDKNYEVIYVNPTFEKLTGYAPKDVIGKSCLFLANGAVSGDSSFSSKIANSLKLNVPIEIKFPQQKKDGSIFLNELGIAPILNLHGVAEYYVGTFHDITKSDRDNFLLQQVNAIAKIGLWSANTKENYITFHRSTVDVLGFSLPRGNKIPLTEFTQYLGEHNHGLIKKVMDTINQGQVFSDIVSIKLKTKSELSYFKVFAHRFSDREIVGLIQDVTDITNAQKELDLVRLQNVNASRLSALGEMAAGMAHEINNPLTVISASVDVLSLLLSKFTEPHPEFETYLKRIRETVVRISKILNSMKKISRTDEMIEFDEVNLQTIFDDLENLTISRFRMAGVQLNTVLSDPKIRVKANEISLTQVMLNLLNNAFDEAVNKPVKDRWIKIKTSESNNKVLIDVIDAGLGIDAKTVEKLFNPFFTTKDIGKGTGLGLSISKALMEKMHGDISYKVVEGHTCFRLELPKV